MDKDNKKDAAKEADNSDAAKNVSASEHVNTTDDDMKEDEKKGDQTDKGETEPAVSMDSSESRKRSHYVADATRHSSSQISLVKPDPGDEKRSVLSSKRLRLADEPADAHGESVDEGEEPYLDLWADAQGILSSKDEEEQEGCAAAPNEKIDEREHGNPDDVFWSRSEELSFERWQAMVERTQTAATLNPRPVLWRQVVDEEWLRYMVAYHQAEAEAAGEDEDYDENYMDEILREMREMEEAAERAERGADDHGDGGVDEHREGGADEHGEGGVDEHSEGGADEHGEGGVNEHGEGGVNEHGEGGAAKPDEIAATEQVVDDHEKHHEGEQAEDGVGDAVHTKSAGSISDPAQPSVLPDAPADDPAEKSGNESEDEDTAS